MNKKVLIIITTAFVPYGGLTTVMMNYYRAMDKTGLQIDFASTNDPPKVLLDELEANGSAYFNLGNRKKQLPKYLKNLKTVLTNGHYEVIHVNGNSATMAFEFKVAKKCGVSMRIAHGHNTRTSHTIINKLMKPFFAKLYTCAVSVSELAGEWLYCGKSYIILNNAIDLKKYSFDSVKREIMQQQLGIENKIVLGNVGKLNEQKNHIFLLKVICSLRKKGSDVCLLLIGGGHMETQLREECKNLEIEDCVIFVGMVDNAADYFQAMDIFVFPSLWEGLPLSVLEAQASGLPCIISSNVSKSVKCTENAVFMDLAEGAEAWAKKAVDVSENLPDRTDVIDEIKRSGYDIQEEAKKLRMIYLNERK